MCAHGIKLRINPAWWQRSCGGWAVMMALTYEPGRRNISTGLTTEPEHSKICYMWCPHWAYVLNSSPAPHIEKKPVGVVSLLRKNYGMVMLLMCFFFFSCNWQHDTLRRYLYSTLFAQFHQFLCHLWQRRRPALFNMRLHIPSEKWT